MKNLQSFAKEFQKEMKWDIDTSSYERSRSSLLNNFMLLTTEVSEVAEELRKVFNLTNKYIVDGMDEEKAFKNAMMIAQEDLGKEFADCIAYICKIANFFEVDLETSFYSKMEEVKNRKNKDIRLIDKS
ncbi:NTP pyrophosphatase (non-canonical NTP hydrolase) [Bacillus aryabhattai]|uniref:NTP pyrophosphatase (Non-canonical NTP hydrolase) n=1 Tax=Priestia aryabhattai TaxID=412384 RepID=A0A7W3NG32_PRIAR|nr:MazG nucleotide pyrophosphohydrolase domain-containing protein [Priestia aryabhattai]MBA9042375.1 NTP pyrophosphatase (non-canonical NTP hydrolase) [Priestia aryabhattai]